MSSRKSQPRKYDEAAAAKKWQAFTRLSKRAPKGTPAQLAAQARRLRWWQEARFGMFVHWGLYSTLARHEWVMNRERIPVREYEKLADAWKPGPRPAREWARMAKAAGMKYMVMTTKHHEGFCLWDTQQTEYNAVRRGPGRDLVAEYVAACREFGLRVGLYYSLMDWHHPDGARCATDEAARKRFAEFTHGCVRELLSNYGKIDILWYDVPWPLDGAGWESRRLNRMARSLQPHLLINDRAWLPEDFTTPEEQIKPPAAGRAWEACMTFNGSWGYMPAAIDWHSARTVVGMLRQVACGGGNLILNIGPSADGAVPTESISRLKDVGKWLALNGEAIYGQVTPTRNFDWLATGNWTQKGNVAYFWVNRWQPDELAIGGLKTKLRKASYLATGKTIRFRQEPDRLILKGLPKQCPDRIVNCCVIKLEFAGPPKQALGPGCVNL